MDVTSTVQTLQQAQAVVQGAQTLAAQVGWPGLIVAGTLGVAAAPVGQAIIEHWTSGPKMPAKVKALAPLTLALGLGYLATRFHVTPEQAATAGTLFASAMHIYNETPLAANVDQVAK